MKKVFLFILLSCLAVSCTKSEGGEEPLPEPATYVVTLKPTGDIAPFVPSGTGDDLYGVQIYAKPRKGKGEYKPYAYGQFYDVSKMQVELSNQYKYRIVCTAWRHHKENASGVFPGSDNGVFPGSDNGVFPVWQVEGGMAPLSEVTDAFVLSVSEYLEYLGDTEMYGGVSIVNRHGNERDLYHCQQNDFIPKDGSPVSLEMRHVSFGIKIKVTGMTKGCIGTHLGYIVDPHIFSLPKVIYPQTESKGMFALYGFGYNGQGLLDNYAEEMVLFVTWRESSYDEDYYRFQSPDVHSSPNIQSTSLYTFRGNKLYTITADVPSKTFTIKEEPFPAGGM